MASEPNFVAKILQTNPYIVSYDVKKIKDITGIIEADITTVLIPYLTNKFHTVIYIPNAHEFMIPGESSNTVSQAILDLAGNYSLLNKNVVRKL